MYRKLLTLSILTLSLAHADETIYYTQDNKAEVESAVYSRTADSLARYLAYRDVPSFITKYALGKKALDYGCGAGISTQFLINQGLEVTAVDKRKEMVKQATTNCPNIPVFHMENEVLPIPSSMCDIVFSSLVLFELDTEEAILTYLDEAKRVLTDDGVFIAVTGSEHMYTKNWYLLGNQYDENKDLKDGDLAKVYLHDSDIEFMNYYRTEESYRRLYEQAGLELIEVHYPLAPENDHYSWKDEIHYSPFVVLVAKKKG